MAKTKLSTRIFNAYRALRGDPWPVVLEGPKITYTLPNVVTFGAETSCPLEFIDLQSPEVTNKEAQREIAQRIGMELLNAGAIEIRQAVDLRNGRLNYHGRVRVVMPGEEGDGHG